MNLKSLYEKYKDVIPYLFFGVCTTTVNVVVYWLCAHPLGLAVMASTVIAWVLAVLFAFFTNRKWVFHSENTGFKSVGKEMLMFFACRLATGAVDWICMYVFVDMLHWNDMLVKFCANIIVIILNYLASKILIFRRKK